MADPYQESAVPIYIVAEGDIMLDGSPDEVWPSVIDLAAWQNYKYFEHVAGPVDAAGELKSMHKDEPGSGGSPYRVRTIKVDPGKTIMYKNFRDVPAAGDSDLGIVQFILTPRGEKTHFQVKTIYEFNAPACPEAEWMELRRTYQTKIETLLSGVLPKLPALVNKRLGEKSAA